MKSFFSAKIPALLLSLFLICCLFTAPAYSAETLAKNTATQVLVSVSSQSIPDNATVFTKVLLDTETVDTRREFSTSTYKFTAITSGLYLISGIASFTADDDGCRAVQLWVNGSASNVQAVTCSATSAPALIVNACGVLNLTAGDYVEMYCRQNSGAAITIDSSTRFSVSRLY